MQNAEEIRFAALLINKLQEGIAACGFVPSRVGMEGTFTNIMGTAICSVTEPSFFTWDIELHGHLQRTRHAMGGDLIPDLAHYTLTLTHGHITVTERWTVTALEQDTPERFREAFCAAARKWYSHVKATLEHGAVLVTTLEQNTPVPVRSA